MVLYEKCKYKEQCENSPDNCQGTTHNCSFYSRYQSKEYYRAHKEHVKAYHKEYAKTHKDKIDQQRKIYSQTRQEEKHEYNQKYMAMNKDRLQKYRDEHKSRAWARAAISNHKNWGYKISPDLTIDYVEKLLLDTGYICPICKVTMTHNKTGLPNSPSLDDINNTHYLSPDNVRVICLACNTMKGPRTYEQWLDDMKIRVENLENIVDGGIKA